MAIARQRKNVSYGLTQPLADLTPQPISSTRAPTTSDMAEVGTTWVRRSTNQAWVLASIVANSATWTPLTVNAGATITTGDLTVTAGTIDVAVGDVDLVLGDVVVRAGDVDVTAGDITATAGNVECVEVVVTGDGGAGSAGNVVFTDTVDTGVSTGVVTINTTTANPTANSGWLKIYVGTNTRYIPFVTDIAP